jgi:hypothetical protein
MSIRNPQIILRIGKKILDEDAEVEWYSGSELYTHPCRIKLKGIWEDIFRYEKRIEEDAQHRRETIFRCHIGDNRIIEIAVRYMPDIVQD